MLSRTCIWIHNIGEKKYNRNFFNQKENNKTKFKISLINCFLDISHRLRGLLKGRGGSKHQPRRRIQHRHYLVLLASGELPVDARRPLGHSQMTWGVLRRDRRDQRRGFPIDRHVDRGRVGDRDPADGGGPVPCESGVCGGPYSSPSHLRSYRANPNPRFWGSGKILRRQDSSPPEWGRWKDRELPEGHTVLPGKPT